MTKNAPNPEDLIALARTLRLAMIVVAPDGTVEAIATKAELALGLARGEGRGRKVAELSLDPERFEIFLRDCQRSDALIPGSFSVTGPGGVRAVRCQGARVPGPPNSKTRVLVLLGVEPLQGFTLLQERLEDLGREIMLRRRVEAEYRKLLEREKKARRAAEEADRMKDEFLAIVSHELRTPLNAVLSWAEILMMESLEGRSADAVERIARNARAQADLIDQLLDTSRIVSNQIGLERREVVVGDVLRDSVEAVRPSGAKRGVEIEIAGEQSARAVLDPARIRQVLINLLENAVKFSAEGGKVTAHVNVDAERVEFRVEDRGRGLLPDEIGYVFDRFRQVSQDSRRKHGGLGLGLAIAKNLVELHGGTIRAESAGLDHGATFVFELPRAAEPATTLAPVDQSAPPPDGGFLQGRAVLVVEDNDDARDALVQFLERYDADVTGVASVAAAVGELDGFAPTFILTDLQMPEEDGYDLLRQVRGDERHAAIPVLALTAHARPEDKKRAREAGFDAYLAKPIPPTELLRALAPFCGAQG